MRVKWTRPALTDFIDACHYIAEDNPAAARRIGQRLWDAAQRLSDNPRSGRDGRRPDTREWVVNRTPHLLVYRVGNDCVEILRVWHMKRDPQALENDTD